MWGFGFTSKWAYSMAGRMVLPWTGSLSGKQGWRILASPSGCSGLSVGNTWVFSSHGVWLHEVMLHQMRNRTASLRSGPAMVAALLHNPLVDALQAGIQEVRA